MTRLMISVAIIVAGLLVGAQNPEVALGQSADQQITDGFLADSGLMAAFLVAYKAHQEWWRSKGVALTPKELIMRHHGVHCARSGDGRFVISFWPPADTVIGGGVTYMIDEATLDLLEQKFEK
jgi:hypothetical protein